MAITNCNAPLESLPSWFFLQCIFHVGLQIPVKAKTFFPIPNGTWGGWMGYKDATYCVSHTLSKQKMTPANYLEGAMVSFDLSSFIYLHSLYVLEKYFCFHKGHLKPKCESTYRRGRLYKGMCLSGVLVRPFSQEQKISPIPRQAGLARQLEQTKWTKESPQRSHITSAKSYTAFTTSGSERLSMNLEHLCQKAPVKRGWVYYEESAMSFRCECSESHINVSEHGTYVRLKVSLTYSIRLNWFSLQLSCLHHHTLPNSPEGSGSPV